MNRPQNQRGIALVIVLWGVTLMSLLAASFAQNTGLAARRELHEIASAEARARLDELVAIAVIALTQPDPRQRWRADGAPHEIGLAAVSLAPAARGEVRAFGESGRIDLNHAPDILLQSLFRRAANDPGLGDRLAGWLAERTLANSGRPLLSVAELAAFPGMNATLYRRLAGSVTVHNNGGKLDWHLASSKTLAAIPGLSAEQLASLLAAQRQSRYTPDLALTELLTKAGVMVEPAPESGSGGARMVTLQMRVTLASGASASAEALLQLPAAPGQKFQILEWRAPAAAIEPS